MSRDKSSFYPDDVFTLDYALVRDFFIKKKIHIKEVENGRYSNIHFNLNTALETDARFSKTNRVCSMGAFSYSHSELGHGVKVGRYCSVGSGLTIMGADHYPDWISTSPKFYTPEYHSDDFEHTDLLRSSRNIEIGNDVWIGSGVTLKRNLKIGDGAIIATGSIVTRDVLPFQIVGGVPAKVIKMRFSEELVSRIQNLSWWDYHFHKFKGLDASDPESFVSRLEEMVDVGLEKYSPGIITQKEILQIARQKRIELKAAKPQ